MTRREVILRLFLRPLLCEDVRDGVCIVKKFCDEWCVNNQRSIADACIDRRAVSEAAGHGGNQCCIGYGRREWELGRIEICKEVVERRGGEWAVGRAGVGLSA